MFSDILLPTEGITCVNVWKAYWVKSKVSVILYH